MSDILSEMNFTVRHFIGDAFEMSSVSFVIYLRYLISSEIYMTFQACPPEGIGNLQHPQFEMQLAVLNFHSECISRFQSSSEMYLTRPTLHPTCIENVQHVTGNVWDMYNTSAGKCLTYPTCHRRCTPESIGFVQHFIRNANGPQHLIFGLC